MPFFMRISGNVFIGVNVTTKYGFQNNEQKRQYSVVLFCCSIFCCSFDFLQNFMSFSLYNSFGISNKCSSKRCHSYKSSNKTADTIGHQCMLCEFLAYKSDKFLRNKLFNNVPLCDSSVD